MKFFVCFAYRCNTLLLRYVCIQACYIHRYQNSILRDLCLLYKPEVCCILKIRSLCLCNPSLAMFSVAKACLRSARNCDFCVKYIWELCTGRFQSACNVFFMFNCVVSHWDGALSGIAQHWIKISDRPARTPCVI